MKETGKKVSFMGKESKHCLMAQYLTGTGLMDDHKALECANTLMVQNTLDSGSMDSLMVKEQKF